MIRHTRCHRWPSARRAAALLVVGVLLACPASTARASTRAQGAPVPVYAYFYQWFNHTSWNRAKVDYPLAGRYSSDDRNVLQSQITQAQQAGLSGFLTSWKSTPTLNRRLQMLLDVARPRDFDVGVVYEALDFRRKPLPIGTVRHDLVQLVTRWQAPLTSRSFGRPVIIWTGTADYPVQQIRQVRDALGGRAYLLASAKSAADYDRVAAYVDGDAYYWSSANPGTAYTRQRLDAIAAAVHRHHGIWLAPALAGFDGRTLGHQRVVPRDDGQALVRSLDDAFSSRPDAVGVISWNEWSENTYVEPGKRYGKQELDTLAGYLHVRHGNAPAAASMARAGDPAWAGLQAAAVLAAATLLVGGFILRRARRRRRP